MLCRIGGRTPVMLVMAALMIVGEAAVAAETPPAAPAANGPRKIQSIEGITEYEYPNGLKLLLFPDPSKPTVTINMTVLVGSRHEGYGEAGMAHLLEHMLFKGTPRFHGPTAIPSALQKRGADYNAATWTDRTNFHETLPANDANIEFAIKLEADRLVNSELFGADLKSEMTVVRSEFERGENNPEMILMQRMMAAAYEWHNYGKSTIGNRADIERVPIENLREFYVRYYQPDNTMVVVAGKFDPTKVLGFVSKYFGRIPRPERQLNMTYTEEPPQDGEHVVRLRRAGDVAVVGLTYHVPAGGHPDFPAVEVLEGILTDEPSGRLYKALIQTKMASSVGGETFAWHDPGVTIVMAEVVQGHQPEKVLEALLTAVDDVEKKGVTREETERIKRMILKHREMAASNTGRIALELSEWAAQGDWRLYFVHRDRIEKVSAADVSKAAAKYLKRDNRTVGLFLPTKSPDRTRVPMIGDLAKSIGDYKGREDVAMGEAFDVSPESIDSRTKTQTLASGVKAAFLEKKTRGHMVHVYLKLRYGDVNTLRGMLTASQLLPALMERGTKTMSHQQIQDELDQLKATLRVEGSPGEATFSIVTRRDSLPAVLKLLGKILREPSLPENELEILKRAKLAALESGLSEPGSLAMAALRRHLAPYPKGDPRYVPTIKESMDLVKAVSVDDVKKLYTDYLNGTHGDLVVLGDFDAAQVAAQIDSILANWKAPLPWSHVSRDIKDGIPGGKLEILTPDKANATYIAALIFPMRDDDPDVPALALGNYILGESTLSSRLGDRVRQKEGLSYGVVSMLQSSALDHRSVLLVNAICNPVNMEKLRKAIAEEIERLLSKGISAKELATAKEGYLNQEQTERAGDRTLTQLLAINLSAGRSMKYYADREKHIRELTADEVIATMRRRFDPKRFFVVTAGDFGKSEASN